MTQPIGEATAQRRKVSFVLPVTRQSARLARKLTEVALETWECSLDGETAVLLVSELVTNALLHGVSSFSPEDRITVDLEESPLGLHVEVHDPDQGNRDHVAFRLAAESSETGRGLELVEALSTRWGWQATSGGKCVYFDMALPESEELATSTVACPIDLTRTRTGVLA